MNLNLLTGLVSVEKIDLTIALARHFTAQGEQVTVIDNISRLAMDAATLPAGVAYQRINRLLDFRTDLAEINADRVLIALSETAPPDQTFTALLDLPTHVQVQSLALIDTRTCDCFPAIRERLEAYADLTVAIPFDVQEVIANL